MRGFWGIGIWHPKTETNVGTLWRTAKEYQASFVYTIGARYRHQSSDTPKTPLHIPLFHYSDIEDLVRHLPHSTPLVGIELDSRSHSLDRFIHPERACYLLGAEDHRLSEEVINRCHQLVSIPSPGRCLNVAVAGSIVIYDRWIKRGYKSNARPKGKTSQHSSE